MNNLTRFQIDTIIRDLQDVRGTQADEWAARILTDLQNSLAVVAENVRTGSQYHVGSVQ